MASRDTTPEVSPLTTPASTPPPAAVEVPPLDSDQEEGEISEDELSVVRSVV
jgi:hypothetical protein